MKTRALRQSIVTAMVSLLLPFAVSAGQGTRLSKESVQAVLESIDQAFVKKDAAGVVANFASNAVITATVVEGKHTDTTKYETSSNYGAVLASGFKSFGDYKLTRKEVTIEISADGKTATVTSTVVETFSFDGKAKRAVTKESATLELIDRKILIAKVHDEVAIE